MAAAAAMLPNVSSVHSGTTFKQRMADRAARVTAMLAQLAMLISLFPEIPKPVKGAPATAEKAYAMWQEMCDLQNVIDYIFPGGREALARASTAFLRKQMNLFISKFNSKMHELSSLSATLRKKPEDGLVPGKTFIRSHLFPRYDRTNGFESDETAAEQIRILQNPRVPTIVSHVDSAAYNLADPEAKTDYTTGFVLRASRRKVAFATPKNKDGIAAMKSALLFAIDNAKRVLPVAPVRRADHGHKGIRDTGAYGPTLPDFSTFNGYCLDLFFIEGCTVASASEEVKRMVDLLPGFLPEFSALCRDKIITLVRAGITKKDPAFANILFVSCKHVGCQHAAGFFFNRIPLTSSERQRESPQCPNGHGFCQRCHELAHQGFCVDFDEQRRLAIEQAMRENPGLDIKPCPSCAEPVEKNGGCDHMNCDKCKWHFCWQCLMMFSSSEQFYNGHRQCSGRAGVW